MTRDGGGEGERARDRERIARCGIFRGVPWSAVEEIVARCEIRELDAGEVLLRAGDPNRHVALVLDGELHVHRDGNDSPHYLPVLPGEAIGELSVIGQEPVSATVIVGQRCRLLLVDVDTFLLRLLPIPNVARNVMVSLVSRIRRNDRLLIERVRESMELERLHRELGFAREIQMSMLPRQSPLFPERREIDAAGRMIPAREVGGDFYDAFFIDPRRVFVAIGDVCGKGLPAAMFMMRTLTLLRSEASRRAGESLRHAEAIAARVNEAVCEGNPSGLFVSLFFAILDVETGRLAFVSAGHNPPLLGGPRGAFSYLEPPRNLVVGAMPDVDYRAGELTLSPGQALVLYTDGVTEATDGAGAMYGEERLASLLSAARERTATALVGSALDAVATFAGATPQSDDVTVLVLRYEGGSGPWPP